MVVAEKVQSQSRCGGPQSSSSCMNSGSVEWISQAQDYLGSMLGILAIAGLWAYPTLASSQECRSLEGMNGCAPGCAYMYGSFTLGTIFCATPCLQEPACHGSASAFLHARDEDEVWHPGGIHRVVLSGRENPYRIFE